MEPGLVVLGVHCPAMSAIGTMGPDQGGKGV